MRCPEAMGGDKRRKVNFGGGNNGGREDVEEIWLVHEEGRIQLIGTFQSGYDLFEILIKDRKISSPLMRNYTPNQQIKLLLAKFFKLVELNQLVAILAWDQSTSLYFFIGFCF
jgi:hypothetical protein